jgi:hypothetical protein
VLAGRVAPAGVEREQPMKPVAIITHPARPARKYSQRNSQLSNWMKWIPEITRWTRDTAFEVWLPGSSPVTPSK